MNAAIWRGRNQRDFLAREPPTQSYDRTTLVCHFRRRGRADSFDLLIAACLKKDAVCLDPVGLAMSASSDIPPLNSPESITLDFGMIRVTYYYNAALNLWLAREKLPETLPQAMADDGQGGWRTVWKLQ